MQKHVTTTFLKAAAAIGLGIFCALFAWGLKTTAEGSERLLFHFIQEHFIWLLLIAPLAGLFFIALIKKAFIRLSAG